MAFHVGQKVVCVNDGCLSPEQSSLSARRIYTIRELFVCPFTKGSGVRVEEIRLRINPCLKEEFGYEAWRFRPVRTTDISVFTEMLNTVPTEREPVA